MPRFRFFQLSLWVLVFLISLSPLHAQDREADSPHLRYTPPFPMALFQDVQMTAEVSDPEGVRAVRLFYRKKGESDYKTAPFERKEGNEKKGIYVRSMPRSEIAPQGVEYYLVAENAAGRIISKGTADHPLFIKRIAYRTSEVRQRFQELKRAWEEKDLIKIKALSDLKKSKEEFLRQLFETYRSIDLEMKMDEAEMTEETASALFTIKTLIDRDGNTVLPGEWAQARVELSSLRDDPDQWKMNWK